MLGDQSILQTNKYEFPERMIQEEDDKIEIRNPIQMTYDDIQMDMYDYAKDFNQDDLPHITEANEIVDHVHNYPKPQKNMKRQIKGALSSLVRDKAREEHAELNEATNQTLIQN